MIALDLACVADHRFEGWFADRAEFDRQVSKRLVSCPICGSEQVEKRLSAPNIGRGSAGKAADAADVRQAMIRALAEAQGKALQNSTWVGDSFAEEARAIHYGEREDRLIYGRASADEAKALVEEGVKVAPLPLPVVPPEAAN